MGDLYCPYCDEEIGSHVDDCYEQDVEYEHECPKCEKNFIFNISYSPNFDSWKADCLNGEKHNYEKMCGYPKELFVNRRRCSMCSKEVTVCKNCEKEKSEHNIHPTKGTYHCKFGDDTKLFALVGESEHE